MRKHHISIMTLEEYEPNREFVGRNFNAGEVIQLVLRSPSTGRWLPFEYVQMVMMHELAHCKQMNHSRAFWAVRNQYAAQMYELWRDGYTGDGVWGRGAKLATGEWERNQVKPDEVLPEHLCGGTYRSRRRKRSAKPTLTYQERKERRILKKFGANGIALGADDEAKVKLEKGKKVQAKPRVASSARGRDLRAAAALARFEQQKVKDEDVVKDEDETESGSDTEFEEDTALIDAVDVDGSTMRDSQGRGLVKVCEDEDTSDPEARNELSQLADMFRRVRTDESGASRLQTRRVKEEPDTEETPSSVTPKREPAHGKEPSLDEIPLAPSNMTIKAEPNDTLRPQQQSSSQSAPGCPVCSFANPTPAATCAMCANVLNPKHTPNCWRCANTACMNRLYVNSADCGVCGLCGQRRD
jgi:hypothetical protein